MPPQPCRRLGWCPRLPTRCRCTQFRTHAATYQTASAKAAVIHEQFVTTLATSASSYADTEAANAVVTG